MSLEDTTYHEFLQSVLVQRQQKNASYSLRAFARDLDLSPSTVSDILKGKGGISKATAERLAKRLKLNNTDAEFLCALVESETGRTPAARKEASKRLKKLRGLTTYTQMSVDVFNSIADWYHAAIMELIVLPGFRDDPDWLAQKLGIDRSDARRAMVRLQRLGMIAETKSGWRLTTARREFRSHGIESLAIREFHRQMLGKALAALEEQKLLQRDFSAMTVAIDEKDIPWVKTKIQEFILELGINLANSENREKLYSLNVQFFQVSHDTPEKKPLSRDDDQANAPIH